ncbi:hypothetical protein AXG93_3507s1050 [Marchantia polymorpha subsp. ruderalis]|uniref:Uncharacterized protein n=1 Tax=Marchantia polymorpha subsp. ruderalis TaxID=1480154 RepID=A0A176VEA8_MARPO|nr:hypothetical protein AXG93_3507s1050 [Marchantia polymorpha subsp. ruderalis]
MISGHVSSWYDPSGEDGPGDGGRISTYSRSSRGEVGRRAGVRFSRRRRENGEAEEAQEEAQADSSMTAFYRKNPVVCNDGSQATAQLSFIRSGAERTT